MARSQGRKGCLLQQHICLPWLRTGTGTSSPAFPAGEMHGHEWQPQQLCSGVRDYGVAAGTIKEDLSVDASRSHGNSDQMTSSLLAPLPSYDLNFQ